MASATYPVKSSVLRWVLDSSSEILSHQWKEKIESWLSGKTLPTIIQLQNLSRASHISFGNFFLDNPPKENLPLLNYRTINNNKVIKPSKNMIDVIHQMELRADWLQDYYKNEGLDPIPFVGAGRKKLNLKTDKKAESILTYFDLSLGWNLRTRDAFNFLKKKLENARIAIILGSYIGRQNTRKLDIDEFRAFVLVNDYAPLIFINTQDSQKARLFSLVHELVHIWMGDSELLNNNFSNEPEYLKPTSEQEINKIVEQILFPKQLFENEWHSTKEINSKNQRIFKIARRFGTSPLATAITAKKYNFISQKEVNQIKAETAKNTKKYKEKQRESSDGPSYYKVFLSNLDHNFARSVINSTESGQTSYTEAFDLLGVSGNKGFHEIKNRLEVER